MGIPSVCFVYRPKYISTTIGTVTQRVARFVRMRQYESVLTIMEGAVSEYPAHNWLQCRQSSRIELRQQATRREILVMLEHAVPEICVRTDRQTD